MFCPYALIFIPLVSVKTMSSFALTVRWSTMLPQSASSNSVTISGSFSTDWMNLSSSRLRMPLAEMSAVVFSYSAFVASNRETFCPVFQIPQ